MPIKALVEGDDRAQSGSLALTANVGQRDMLPTFALVFFARQSNADIWIVKDRVRLVRCAV